MTSITITKGAVETPIYLRMLNRHGLIAGATGTGKTVTLKVLTEKIKQRRYSGLSSRYQGRFIWLSQSRAMDAKTGRTLQASWDHRSV